MSSDVTQHQGEGVWSESSKRQEDMGLSQLESVFSMVSRSWVQFHGVYKVGNLQMAKNVLIYVTFKAIGCEHLDLVPANYPNQL